MNGIKKIIAAYRFPFLQGDTKTKPLPMDLPHEALRAVVNRLQKHEVYYFPGKDQNEVSEILKSYDYEIADDCCLISQTEKSGNTVLACVVI